MWMRCMLAPLRRLSTQVADATWSSPPGATPCGTAPQSGVPTPKVRGQDLAEGLRTVAGEQPAGPQDRPMSRRSRLAAIRMEANRLSANACRNEVARISELRTIGSRSWSRSPERRCSDNESISVMMPRGASGSPPVSRSLRYATRVKSRTLDSGWAAPLEPCNRDQRGPRGRAPRSALPNPLA